MKNNIVLIILLLLSLVTPIQSLNAQTFSVADRLKGNILLQVESHGEAWYVLPREGKRLYMKSGDDAFTLMRFHSLGITNKDLSGIKIAGTNTVGNLSLTNRLRGYILLQVESQGESWYVHPRTGERHYLPNGAAAYALMRFHSLGISNSDLSTIPIFPPAAAATTPISTTSTYSVTTTQGNTFFVTAGQDGDGSSPHSAWGRLDEIDWSKIKPGDKIQLSGSFYGQSLKVTTGGTADKPVVISGPAVLDGQMKTANGIIASDVSNVIIENFTLRNFTGSGQIKVSHATNISVLNNKIHVTGHGGVHLHNTEKTVVANNIITTPSSTTAQTDGIYSQNSRFNHYRDNHITITNTEPNGHNDGIQIYKDSNGKITGNTITLDNPKKFNSQGIYITESHGTMDVTGNQILAKQTCNSLIALLNIKEGTATLVAENNNVYGGCWGIIKTKNSPRSVIKNNLIRTDRAAANLLWVDKNLPTTNISQNTYIGIDGFYLRGESDKYNWTEWQTTGFDQNSSYNQ
ncbi:MAG: right-handed parallel beta-helix repeat-containing protein [Candidatus Komeilibacteria bacterium]|nr:right-handed parallel beta-helix repeat-containing protein [Candidatus Komeilibacteria bacterium]